MINEIKKAWESLNKYDKECVSYLLGMGYNIEEAISKKEEVITYDSWGDIFENEFDDFIEDVELTGIIEDFGINGRDYTGYQKMLSGRICYMGGF